MKDITFHEVFIEYYKGVLLFGVIMSAIALWVYEYQYIPQGNDILGIISACCLFFGILLIGLGIRGWRDGEEHRHRYIKMKSRKGANLTIKKRKKKWSR
ncbi:hypothetical protein HQ545_03260 [Candidatus Woesearchaeota archaeon]|nr:hypothetical protein [Candidatus Woesearchaeota archaeon]